VVRQPSLIAQILAVNALLIVGAVLAAAAVVRLDASGADERQILVLIAAILATLLVNGFVLRRRFAPLERLIDVMEHVDLATETGDRAVVKNADSAEVARLQQAFNRMLERLRSERARTARAVLRGQEAERARLARDLHDEANQSLTGILLGLEAAAQRAPAELHNDLRQTLAAARAAIDELLSLARELRPTVLDDMGLEAALRTLVARFGERWGVHTDLHIDADASELDADAQVVVYRMVQEALSNVARHAEAEHVSVALTSARAGGITVTVSDDGRGLDPATRRREGLGLVGMRERAWLAGGRLDIRSRPREGTKIELVLPCGS
jgi:two-component system sensor histidine kinase UhpB